MSGNLAVELWNKCLAFLSENLDKNSFQNWFTPIVPLDLNLKRDEEGDYYEFVLQIPSQFYLDTILEKYGDTLIMSVKRYVDKRFMLSYRIPDSGQQTLSHNPNPTTTTQTNILPSNTSKSQFLNPFAIPGFKKVEVPSQLKKEYTMSNFIEGKTNEFARSVGLNIVENIDRNSYSPFFVFGGVGLGKTHLAHAIGWEVKEKHPDKIVLYLSAEQFMQQYVKAAKDKKVTDFIRYYQRMDFLIIDDIHVLSGKEKTQEAFFHIFNHIQDLQKNLIFTSDKAPKDLIDFSDRIISRLKWGITAEIEPPDYDTRLKIINKKIAEQGVTMNADVVEYLVSRVSTNIRELEGALNSLIARSIHLKSDFTIQMAEETLNYLINDVSKKITIDSISKTVCHHLHLKLQDLQVESRKSELVRARQITMYLSRKYTEHTIQSIGEHIGKKDHSTVIHSCRVVENLRDTDKKFKAMFDLIERKIKS